MTVRLARQLRETLKRVKSESEDEKGENDTGRKSTPRAKANEAYHEKSIEVFMCLKRDGEE